MVHTDTAEQRSTAIDHEDAWLIVVTDILKGIAIVGIVPTAIAIFFLIALAIA